MEAGSELKLMRIKRHQYKNARSLRSFTFILKETA
jgi:hypothetical protein